MRNEEVALQCGSKPTSLPTVCFLSVHFLHRQMSFGLRIYDRVKRFPLAALVRLKTLYFTAGPGS